MQTASTKNKVKARSEILRMGGSFTSGAILEVRAKRGQHSTPSPYER